MSAFDAAIQGMASEMTTTENGALAFKTSEPSRDMDEKVGARTDLFFHTVRGVGLKRLTTLMEASAKENLLDTLRMCFYCRDIRGKGKGEKELFFHMWSVLAQLGYGEHLVANLALVPHYGSWKDVVRLSRPSRTAAGRAATDLLARSLGEAWEQSVKAAEEEENNEAAGEADGATRKAATGGGTVGLLAKWLPSEGKAHDRAYRGTKRLRESLGWSQEEYRKRVNRLREEAYIVERQMCAGGWDEVEYGKVPGQAMKKLSGAFAKNDAERFGEFKAALASNLSKPEEERDAAVKVNTKTIMPHEIYQGMKKLRGGGMSGGGDARLLEAQWATKLEEVRKELGDSFDSTLCVADVSGSMSGLPMDVSIGLSLFLSTLVKGHFKGRIISFHASPTFHVVDTSQSLWQQMQGIEGMPWGMNTDLNKVFRLILDSAKRGKLAQEDMPSRLLILSDMQFDVATSHQTNWELVQQEYAKAGYALPTVVFWNLRAGSGTASVPAKADEDHVALLSGFSPAVLSAVLEGGPVPTPWEVVQKAIRAERYWPVRLATRGAAAAEGGAAAAEETQGEEAAAAVGMVETEAQEGGEDGFELV